MEEALAALHKFFGFEAFREGQGEVIESILAGHDTVVVMPTGGGKSLCYQLPALMRDGVTVVVSPLIALMKDQVDALHARGLPATFINSSLDFEEQKERIAACAPRRVQAALRRARALPQQPLRRDAASTRRSRSSPWTRRTASRNGATTSAPTTCASSHSASASAARRPWRSPRRPRPTSAPTSSSSSSCDEPRAFVSGFDRPNLALGVVHTREGAREERAHHASSPTSTRGSPASSTPRRASRSSR